jgi:hypothetical protein
MCVEGLTDYIFGNENSCAKVKRNHIPPKVLKEVCCGKRGYRD